MSVLFLSNHPSIPFSIYLSVFSYYQLSASMRVCLSACLCVYQFILHCLYIHTPVRCLYVYLFVYPSVRLSMCSSIHVLVYPSVRLSICSSIHLFVYRSVRLSICSSISPSVRLSSLPVCPSTYVFIHIYLSSLKTFTV